MDTRDLRLYSPSKRRRDEAKEADRNQFAYVEPKVMVPYAAAPGRLPREVVVDKTKKLYKSFNVEALLDEVGVEWQNPKAAPGSWLPVEAFDNTDFESRLADEWLEVIKEGGNKPLRGRALWKDGKEGLGSWKDVKVVGYNRARDMFEVLMDDSPAPMLIHRVRLYFEVRPRLLRNGDG